MTKAERIQRLMELSGSETVKSAAVDLGDLKELGSSALETITKHLPIAAGVLGGAPTGYLLSKYLLGINPWLGAALGAGLGGGAGFGIEQLLPEGRVAYGTRYEGAYTPSNLSQQADMFAALLDKMKETGYIPAQFTPLLEVARIFSTSPELSITELAPILGRERLGRFAQALAAARESGLIKWE